MPSQEQPGGELRTTPKEVNKGDAVTDTMPGLYLLRSPVGLYQFGVTANVHAKRKELEKAWRVELDLMALVPMPGALFLETALRYKLAPRIVRGLWFNLPWDEVERIQALSDECSSALYVEAARIVLEHHRKLYLSHPELGEPD